MPEAETIVDTKEQYRDHYIHIRVTATPPLPHDDGTIAAHVKVYDGPPGDLGILNLGVDLLPALKREDSSVGNPACLIPPAVNLRVY